MAATTRRQPGGSRVRYNSAATSGGAPLRLTGKRNQDLANVGNEAGAASRQAGGRANEFGDMLSGRFADPTGGANAYLPFFQQAAEGAAAPQMRDFQNIIGTRAANVAGRFGGNASTEEQRVVQRTGDDFSRNLTEALARVGPQAIGAAQNSTGQMISAQGQAGNQQADFLQMLLSGADKQKEKGNVWGKLLGAGAGAAGGFLAGGPAGAAKGAYSGYKGG